MKKMILPVLSVVLYASCTKPVKETSAIDPNKAYTIKYNTTDQVAKTRVVNDTLHIDFYQKINFLVDPSEYSGSWALHLIQDFSNSYLKDLHFFARATVSVYGYDWVPINLNDAAPGQISTSNVTVDGKKYIQVSLTRLFEFFSAMGSHTAAVNQQNALLQRTGDSVTYKAFYSYNGVYSLSNDASFKIVYTNTP